MDAVTGLPVAIEPHGDAGAADQRGDDDAPGGAAAVGVQVLLALAPAAAQPEGVEEQEEQVQGEAGQRGGPQQQQRLLVVGVLGPELAAGGLPAQIEVGQPVQEVHPPGRRVADPGHGGLAASGACRRGAPSLARGRGVQGSANPRLAALIARALLGPARPGSAASDACLPWQP